MSSSIPSNLKIEQHQYREASVYTTLSFLGRLNIGMLVSRSTYLCFLIRTAPLSDQAKGNRLQKSTFWCKTSCSSNNCSYLSSTSVSLSSLAALFSQYTSFGHNPGVVANMTRVYQTQCRQTQDRAKSGKLLSLIFTYLLSWAEFEVH